MEKMRKIVTQIAATSASDLHRLPLLHRSVVPLLSAAASLYEFSLFIRRNLYQHGLLRKYRLPLPVISVGNLTWGGNGKTPMTEFVALTMAEAGIRPLILTRGYAGGDEAKMLHRHLVQTSARLGVGANRRAIATSVLKRYGHMDSSVMFDHLSSSHRYELGCEKEKVGVVILDDGMQHWSLFRDVEIVMLNSLMPWGNKHLLPRGSLREPLSSLGRADMVVIHHSDLVSDAQLKSIKFTVQKECPSASTYFTRLVPSYLFEVKNPQLKLPLSIVNNMAVLCVSGIGFPDAFVQAISKDIDIIRERLEGLGDGFEVKAIVVTEKDYDRDPIILKKQEDLTILVLCSSIQIIPFKDHTEEDFRMKLKTVLLNKHEWHSCVK